MHKSEVQQGQQLTTTVGSICQYTSCGDDFDGVVQNFKIMATSTMCIRQENNINALRSLDNVGMPSLLRDTP
jgi:hypothetical protein